jgi:hypothetical protein
MEKRKPPEPDRNEPEPLPEPEARTPPNAPDASAGRGPAVVQRLGPEPVPALRR